jgi:CxxC-x17-CxxC domain-containing protein
MDSLVLPHSPKRLVPWHARMLTPPDRPRAGGSLQVSIDQESVIMQDKTLTCRDCGQEFVFTVGEQEFFAQKGFTNEPSRCPACRAASKAGRSGGSYRSRDREMFPAVCAQCGKDTEVPFEPRPDRPVYCSECYAAQRSGGEGRRPGSGDRRSGGGRSGGGGGRRDRDDDRW